MTFHLSLGTRIRRSPFFDATVADGVSHFTVYNRMYMPTGYGDPMAEYWRLIEGVTMWDVACERQVEIAGPHAARLAQCLCPRRVDRMTVGQSRYVPICDDRGVLLNDPVLLKLAGDRFWISLADSDLLLWVRAIAQERRFDVAIHEPDISPLAIQGPKADAVVADLFGDEVARLKLFRFSEATLDGIPLVVARSGFSRQGGFEVYLMDGSRGTDLWNRVKEAGQPHGIAPGNPNQMERIESGLLSFGADTDDRTTPFEVRLGRYVDLDAPDEVIGIDALRREQAEGPKRQQLGVRLGGAEPMPGTERWHPVTADGRGIGMMTSSTWSPRLGENIGLCLVDAACEPGLGVDVRQCEETGRPGALCELPFL